MKTTALVVLCSVMLWSCASTEVPKVKPQQPAAKQQNAGQPQTKVQIAADKAADIVNLLNLTTKVQVKMAYAGTNNFTGTLVPGYQANQCYLQQHTATALAKVADQAERLGYQLQLMDCYRPQRASDYFMAWVKNSSDQQTKAAYYPRLTKAELQQGYIAAHSGHSRASTVDITLLQKTSAGQWLPVDMGGAYDLFDPVSNLNSSDISNAQKANRLLLKDLMQQQGFVSYELEWWHFTLQNETYPTTYFDFVVN